jgi:hypothetical protein
MASSSSSSTVPLSAPTTPLSSLSLVDNLKITTMTINGKIRNIEFNEKNLDEEFKRKLEEICLFDPYIMKISSNFLNPSICNPSFFPPEADIADTIADSIAEHNTEHVSSIAPSIADNTSELMFSVAKKGRKKKDKNKYAVLLRKIQGNGKSFNSQITFTMRCVVNSEKIYNIKVFRTGSYGIPGILNLDNIKKTLQYLTDMMRVHINSEICLESLYTNMNNYKTVFTKPPDSIIKINRLIGVLNSEAFRGLLERPIKFDIFNSNLVSIHFVNSAIGERNLLEPTSLPTDSGKKKKGYLMQLFLSGKICVKGKYELEYMKNHLSALEGILLDESYNVVVKKITDPAVMQEIIKNLPDDRILL